MGTQSGAETPTISAASADTATNSSDTAARPGHEKHPSPSPGATSRLIADRLRVLCLMNCRYHASREAFLDGVHRWFMFIVILLGTAAFVDFAGSHIIHVKEWFGALAAVIAAMDLAFDLSNRARTHSQMKRRYFELLADFGEEKLTPVQARACIDRYSADEEPAFQTVISISWNAAQETVFGDKAHRFEIGWWDRLTRHFVRRGAARYKYVSGPDA